jgi:DNA-binding PadR family transcriptional regulator
MSRASDLSPEFVLLGFLTQGSCHGYELHQRLQNEFHTIWNLSQSQCYNILKRLETHGDLTSEILDQEDAPTKRLLRLTPGGRARFIKWLHEATPGSVRAIRLAFLTRLYFAVAESKSLANRLIQEQKHEILASLNRLQQVLESIPETQKLSQLSMQLRIRQLETCIKWLEDCQDALG